MKMIRFLILSHENPIAIATADSVSLSADRETLIVNGARIEFSGKINIDTESFSGDLQKSAGMTNLPENHPGA
jgi:hypothetical protein